jgi:hypothetical protein
MRNILLALLALFAIGTAFGQSPVWLQDKAFLAGSGMEYKTLTFESGEVMVYVSTSGMDTTIMQNFATSVMADNLEVNAVYFASAHMMFFSDGTVKTNVKIPANAPMSWSRITKALF